jgi:nucleoside phosphorylase
MKFVIQICAELEWKCSKSILKIKKSTLRPQPFGECFEHAIGKHRAVVYESGATKTRASAACQYAIDSWSPDGVINLGTCGGVTKDLGNGAIILVKKAIQYDVRQNFGKPSSKFSRGLTTDIDLSRVDLSGVLGRTCVETIASADQDLKEKQRKFLQRKGVLAADWESASIATICKLNGIKCLILRGVSDIPAKRKNYNGNIQEHDYNRNTQIIMKELFLILNQIEFR